MSLAVALITSATLLGLAGAPHCAAMCSAPCAAVVGARAGAGVAQQIAFHAARAASYALGGAVAASSVMALSAWGQFSPALRPLWVLLHSAALVLGLWLLVTARQPAWMGRLGRVPQPVVAGGGWQRINGPARAAVGGGFWVAWPCGLLQSALLVAAMGNHPATGAAAMAAFAIASAPGLVLGPWLWRRLLQGGRLQAATLERVAVRAAGALLLCVSAWALGHGVWQQVAAYCGLD